MGYFAAKILVVALILLGGLAAFPLGALAAARRSRRRHARMPSSRGLGGAACAGLLLHRERLAAIRVTAGAAPLAERYAPQAGEIVLSDEVAAGISVYDAAAAAFQVAKVALHADGDADFVRGYGRAKVVGWLTNLFPVVLLIGLAVPGEGRAFLALVAPLILVFLVGYTALTLPGERRAATRALALLDRYGFVRDAGERDRLRAALAARAALTLATPLTRCYWIAWAL